MCNKNNCKRMLTDRKTVMLNRGWAKINKRELKGNDEHKTRRHPATKKLADTGTNEMTRSAMKT